jgi:hypothetical protein
MGDEQVMGCHDQQLMSVLTRVLLLFRGSAQAPVMLYSDNILQACCEPVLCLLVMCGQSVQVAVQGYCCELHWQC